MAHGDGCIDEGTRLAAIERVLQLYLSPQETVGSFKDIWYRDVCKEEQCPTEYGDIGLWLEDVFGGALTQESSDALVERIESELSGCVDAHVERLYYAETDEPPEAISGPSAGLLHVFAADCNERNPKCIRTLFAVIVLEGWREFTDEIQSSFSVPEDDLAACVLQKCGTRLDIPYRQCLKIVLITLFDRLRRLLIISKSEKLHWLESDYSLLTTSEHLISTWLETIRDGFALRFSPIFVELQLTFVHILRVRIQESRTLHKRRLLRTLETKCVDVGATKGEWRMIQQAIVGLCDVDKETEKETDGSFRDGEFLVPASIVEEDIDKEGTEARAQHRRAKVNPILWQFLLGIYDDASPLTMLRNNYDVLEKIWLLVLDTYDRSLLHGGGAFRSRQCVVTFPPSRNRYCNMLPFTREWEGFTLPEEFLPYAPMIEACLDVANYSYTRKTMYLTVDERDVSSHESHRRPGLHTESPGAQLVLGDRTDLRISKTFYAWGIGTRYGRERLDGIFMASTVPNSTALYAARIRRPESGGHPLAIGDLGDCEHYRGLVEHTRYSPDANEVVWMTDLTLHESVPLPQKTHRQYFRLVVGKIGAWYEEHSTPNPNCPLPDNVVVVKGSKFRKKEESKTSRTLPKVPTSAKHRTSPTPTTPMKSKSPDNSTKPAWRY